MSASLVMTLHTKNISIILYGAQQSTHAHTFFLIIILSFSNKLTRWTHSRDKNFKLKQEKKEK